MLDRWARRMTSALRTCVWGLVMVPFLGQAQQASNHSALAHLKDIHLPKPIGWWPLAPGWFILFGVILSTFLFVFWGITRLYAHGRAKRRALLLIAEYEKNYQNEPNSQLTTARISELLKRVALAYYPRARVAGLQSEQWLAFLNETSTHLDFKQVRVELLELPYQPPKQHDLTQLFNLARTWIRQRRKPCLS